MRMERNGKGFRRLESVSQLHHYDIYLCLFLIHLKSGIFFPTLTGLLIRFSQAQACLKMCLEIQHVDPPHCCYACFFIFASFKFLEPRQVPELAWVCAAGKTKQVQITVEMK